MGIPFTFLIFFLQGCLFLLQGYCFISQGYLFLDHAHDLFSIKFNCQGIFLCWLLCLTVDQFCFDLSNLCLHLSDLCFSLSKLFLDVSDVRPQGLKFSI
jgi:hypothetical protein